MKEGDVVSLSIGDGRRAILRLLFRWSRDVDVFWVYPEEARAVDVERLTSIRPVLFVGALRNVVASPEYEDRVERVGHCPLTSEEQALPIFCWGGEVYRREELILPVDWDRPEIGEELRIRRERYPSLGVAAFEALVYGVRKRLGFEPDTVEDVEDTITELRATTQSPDRLPPGSPEVVQKVCDRLREPEQRRYIGTRQIANLGRVAAQPAIAVVIELLQDDDSHMVRRGAAHALGHVGYGREDVREALEAARKDEHPQVRQAAADAIQALEDGYYRL